MTEFVSYDPEAINARHGKPTWRCWNCKAEKGLHWWCGVSVAVCAKPECSKEIADFMERTRAPEDE